MYLNYIKGGGGGGGNSFTIEYERCTKHWCIFTSGTFGINCITDYVIMAYKKGYTYSFIMYDYVYHIKTLVKAIVLVD